MMTKANLLQETAREHVGNAMMLLTLLVSSLQSHPLTEAEMVALASAAHARLQLAIDKLPPEPRRGDDD